MSEPNDKRCPDCGVPVGVVHGDNCDVARCLWTGGQRLQCFQGLIAECVRTLNGDEHEELAQALAYTYDLDDENHDCGEDVWTGVWPGEDDARRLGWFSYFGPDYGLRGWRSCPPDHPGATPDLNRLVSEAEWNRETHHWEAP